MTAKTDALNAGARAVLDVLKAKQAITKAPARVTVRELAMLTNLGISDVRDCLLDLQQAGHIRSAGVDVIRVPSWEVLS